MLPPRIAWLGLLPVLILSRNAPAQSKEPAMARLSDRYHQSRGCRDRERCVYSQREEKNSGWPGRGRT